jgi:hypothetical protein
MLEPAESEFVDFDARSRCDMLALNRSDLIKAIADHLVPAHRLKMATDLFNETVRRHALHSPHCPRTCCTAFRASRCNPCSVSCTPTIAALCACVLGLQVRKGEQIRTALKTVAAQTSNAADKEALNDVLTEVQPPRAHTVPTRIANTHGVLMTHLMTH